MSRGLAGLHMGPPPPQPDPPGTRVNIQWLVLFRSSVRLSLLMSALPSVEVGDIL